LHAVRDPEVREARGAERLPEGGADLAAPDAVPDPVAPDARVGVGERAAAIDAGMGEEGLVEVQADADAPRPFDPWFEVRGLERVAFDRAAPRLGIARVEVEAVASRDQREGLLEVGPEFVGGAGAPGVAAGDGEAAARRAVAALETGDIIALPAMDRDGDAREPGERGVGVHAEREVALARGCVGRFGGAGHRRADRARLRAGGSRPFAAGCAPRRGIDPPSSVPGPRGGTGWRW